MARPSSALLPPMCRIGWPAVLSFAMALIMALIMPGSSALAGADKAQGAVRIAAAGTMPQLIRPPRLILRSRAGLSRGDRRSRNTRRSRGLRQRPPRQQMRLLPPFTPVSLMPAGRTMKPRKMARRHPVLPAAQHSLIKASAIPKPVRRLRPGVAAIGGLHLAASHGQIKAIDKLLARTNFLDAKDREGNTALMLAVAAAQQKIVARLLKAGAGMTLINREGESALLIAVRRGYTPLVRMLVEAGALRRTGAARRRMIEREALRHCQAGIIREIFSDRPTATSLRHNGNKAHRSELTIAAARCPANTLVDLLAMSDTQNASAAAANATIAAVRNGNRPALKVLLSQGFASDIADKGGMTPLGEAAMRGRADLVKMLLDNGAKVNHATNAGNTALMLAAHGGNSAIVQLLIDHGGELDLRNLQGMTALMLAVRAGHVEVVSHLLAAGANRELRNRQRETALDMARATPDAARQKTELIKMME